MTDRERSLACQNIIAITHSCGYTGAYEEFISAPIFGELLPGEFQCPACRQAWTVRNVKHPKYNWVDRMVVPIATHF